MSALPQGNPHAFHNLQRVWQVNSHRAECGRSIPGANSNQARKAIEKVRTTVVVAANTAYPLSRCAAALPVVPAAKPW